MMKRKGMTYAAAGVDIAAGNRAVRMIKKKSRADLPAFYGESFDETRGVQWCRRIA